MLLSDDLPLHVGDRLRIVCPDVPEICVDRSVGADGTVDLPIVGPLPAAVKRPSELAKLVQASLPLELWPFPVEVRFLGPSPVEISLTGAVERSLQIFAPRGVDRERLLKAAKPLKDADLTLIGTSKRMRAGTLLEIPSVTAERKISVLGGVVLPQTLSPTEGLTLGRAVEAAGGLTGHGDPNGIIVLRADEPIPMILPADASFLLRPGDVVRVGLVADRHYVAVKGKVARPGAVEYSRGLTATRAITAAGGVLSDLQGGVLIWQTGAKTFRLSLPFILSRRLPDPVLGPEDTIIVEAGKP